MYAQAATNRMSTYSMQAPSLAGTIQTTDSTVSDIRTIATGLERMDNPKLSNQRVSLTEKKADDMKKLALGAKLDRALERRMVGQDAVMRPRGPSLNEKEKMDGQEEEEEADRAGSGMGNSEADGKAESSEADTQSTEETIADGHMRDKKATD
ncbi:hypothetical protein MKZ38_005784 [Zalerion maritima]|uniref:Uncharacterized protein n=1 Tax=Zalerion maritima TaxID=339359 RepID=A0AAD5RJM0_9PEZI|nr:hypothetical protein MKZ38_005784 [Zalerion maritima]